MRSLIKGGREDGKVIGILGFLAQPRANAPGVIAGLRRPGMRRLIMVTGDGSRPARAVATRLGVEHHAEATPAGKLSIVRQWQRDGYGYNLIGLVLALTGVIGPGEAVLFHCTSFVSVVLNSAVVLAYNPRTQDEAAEDKGRPPLPRRNR